MLKLLGAMFILFAGTMLGFYQAMLFNRRPKEIRELLQALQRLETEIRYGGTPLPDALLSAAQPLSAPVAALFIEASKRMSEENGATAAEIWQQTLDRRWSGTAMKPAERQVVSQLGRTLGASDGEDQLKHLRLAAGHLEAEEEAAREDRRKYAAMWRSLGLLGGALVVLLIY